MKHLFKFLACTGALLAFSACSSDSDINPDSNKAQGEETFATFKLNVASQGTRADENADVVEQKITDVTIYIFDGNTLEKVERPSLSGANKTVAVPITTGEKTIYAVTGILKSDENTAYSVVAGQTTLSDFRSQLFASMPETDLAVKNKFLMIGSNRVVLTKCSEEYAEANPIYLKVTRAAAKVQVVFDKTNVNVRPAINATFDNATFSLAQIAKKMYVERAGLFTPNGTKDASGTYPGYTPLTATTTLTWQNALTAFVPDYDMSAYASENVNENPVSGNTTFAVVRLKATPSKVYLSSTGSTITYGGTLDQDGTFYTLARHDATTGTYIFYSDEDFNLVYFPSNGDASTFMTANALDAQGYEVFEYKGGLAYYRVNLVTDNTEGATASAKYCSLRNNFYKITVTDIKAIGSNTAPGLVPTDPDQPLEADTYLVATIDVEDWVAIDMNNTILQ